MAEVKTELTSPLLEISTKKGSSRSKKKTGNELIFNVPKSGEKKSSVKPNLSSSAKTVKLGSFLPSTTLAKQERFLGSEARVELNSALAPSTSESSLETSHFSAEQINASQVHLIAANPTDENISLSQAVISDEQIADVEKLSVISSELIIGLEEELGQEEATKISADTIILDNKITTKTRLESEVKIISSNEEQIPTLTPTLQAELPQVIADAAEISDSTTEAELITVLPTEEKKGTTELTSPLLDKKKKRQEEQSILQEITNLVVTAPIITLPHTPEPIITDGADSASLLLSSNNATPQATVLSLEETTKLELPLGLAPVSDEITTKASNTRTTSATRSVKDIAVSAEIKAVNDLTTDKAITPLVRSAELALDMTNLNLPQEPLTSKFEELTEELRLEDFAKPEALMVATKPTTARVSLLPAGEIEEAKPTNQIKLALTQNLHTNKQKLSVTLTPEYLGKVEIEITVEKGQQTQIKIFAEQQDTLELLINDSINLKQAISEVVKSADVDLSFNLKDGQSSNNQEEQQTANSLYRSPADEQTAVIVKKANSNVHHLSNSAVDIRV